MGLAWPRIFDKETMSFFSCQTAVAKAWRREWWPMWGTLAFSQALSSDFLIVRYRLPSRFRKSGSSGFAWAWVSSSFLIC